MKKPSLNMSSFKDLFVRHVEKLVFGVIAIVALLCAYSAMTRESYDKKPDELMNLVQSARNSLDSSKWTPELAEENNVTFEDPNVLAEQSRTPIHLEAYATKPWDKPINDVGLKRDTPTYLSARQLEASFGIGAFAVVDPNAMPAAPAAAEAEEDDAEGEEGADDSERPTRRRANDRNNRDAAAAVNGYGAGGYGGYGDGGMGGYGGGFGGGMGFGAGGKKEPERWIVVTGLVPYGEQQDIYGQAFATAEYQNAARNTPKYAGYLVQRAEVSDDPEAELNWSKEVGFNLSVFAAKFAKKNWQQPAPDIAPPMVTDSNLTYPLGPLADRQWGPEVLHSSMRSLVQPAPGMMGPPTATSAGEARSGRDDNAQEVEIFGEEAGQPAAVPGMGGPGGAFGAPGGFGGGTPYGAGGAGGYAGGAGYGGGGYGDGGAGYGGAGYGGAAMGGAGYGGAG
ncbi:MAG: hypothetical protein R3C10_07115 [Pirellulales bacterium]